MKYRKYNFGVLRHFYKIEIFGILSIIKIEIFGNTSYNNFKKRDILWLRKFLSAKYIKKC